MTERLFSIGYAVFLSLGLEVVCLTKKKDICSFFAKDIENYEKM